MQKTPWIPKFDEKYYAVSMDGTVTGMIYKDSELDKMFVMSYNYYKTREAAAGVAVSVKQAMYAVFEDILESTHEDQVALNREKS